LRRLRLSCTTTTPLETLVSVPSQRSSVSHCVPRTVADLARTAFACVDLDFERYVEVDPALVRPNEPAPSVGDPAKARERLGWTPQLSFEGLVERMVDADLRSLQDAARPVQGSP